MLHFLLFYFNVRIIVSTRIIIQQSLKVGHLCYVNVPFLLSSNCRRVFLFLQLSLEADERGERRRRKKRSEFVKSFSGKNTFFWQSDNSDNFLWYSVISDNSAIPYNSVFLIVQSTWSQSYYSLNSCFMLTTSDNFDWQHSEMHCSFLWFRFVFPCFSLVNLECAMAASHTLVWTLWLDSYRYN